MGRGLGWRVFLAHPQVVVQARVQHLVERLRQAAGGQLPFDQRQAQQADSKIGQDRAQCELRILQQGAGQPWRSSVAIRAPPQSTDLLHPNFSEPNLKFDELRQYFRLRITQRRGLQIR